MGSTIRERGSESSWQWHCVHCGRSGRCSDWVFQAIHVCGQGQVRRITAEDAVVGAVVVEVTVPAAQTVAARRVS